MVGEIGGKLRGYRVLEFGERVFLDGVIGL